MKSKPKPKRKQKRAVNKKPAFLAAFVACASLTEAAAAVGIDRGQHYEWLKTDPKYPEAFEAAKEQAAQTLEDEAIIRARKGVFEPLTYQGAFMYEQVWDEAGERFVDDKKKPLGTWRKSDGLLQFVLRGLMPGRYRQNGALEISGPKGGPIPLEERRLSKLTDDELSALIATAQKLATAGGDDGGTATPGEK